MLRGMKDFGSTMMACKIQGADLVTQKLIIISALSKMVCPNDIIPLSERAHANSKKN